MKQGVKCGVCWLDEEQWKLLAEIDPDGVDDSFEEWKKSANKAIANFESGGLKVIRVPIKVSEFQEWCKNKRLKPNGSARSRYVTVVMMAADKDS